MIGLLAAGVPLGIVAVVVGMVITRRRSAGRQEFLSMLTLAAERGTPLLPILEAFAAEHRGPLSFEALNMLDRLVAGWSLPDAVDACHALVTPEAKMAIRLGYETQSLPISLRDLLDSDESYDPVWAALAGKVVYIILISAFALAMGTFLMWWIAPRFQAIFEDFDLELPPVTQFLFHIATAWIAYWPLIIPLFFALSFLLCYSLLRLIGAVRWDLPGMGRLKRRLHTAAILQSLALVAERRRSMVDGLKTLTRTYPRRYVQKRLRETLRDVNGGIDWLEALASRRLIGPSDKAVLLAAQRLGNLPWAMREMADTNRRRLSFRAQNWIQVTFACVICFYGGVVALFVIGFFLPLIALIQNLT